jgi:hypothetical protein
MLRSSVALSSSSLVLPEIVRSSVARRSAAQVDGRLPDRLDAREPFLAGLRTQHVAQHSAKQTGVFLEREILIGLRIHSSRF